MTERIRGRRLQERNERIKARDKICVLHKAQGKVAPIEEIDHIVPLYKGGADRESNLQGLCRECHDAKTVTERGDKLKARKLEGLDWIA